MKSGPMRIFRACAPSRWVVFAVALLCAAAPCAAADPPDPSRSPIPVGAPDFWPWSAVGDFVRDEYTATTLVIVLDGRPCATIPPQYTATVSLPRALAILNRAYYDSRRRTGFEQNNGSSRHQVFVTGIDSSGRRSEVRFFAHDAGLISCSDLRGYR